jgi:DNA-binding PadR family transcriptional regulator
VPEASRPATELSPAAWAVLGVVRDGPTHGFAVAQLLAADGALGQVWTVARPMVYRELAKLAAIGLVAERSTQHSRLGPARTIVSVTPSGRTALERWLAEPVEHIREVRSLLLLKLALLARADEDPTALLSAQRERFEPQLQGLRAARDGAEGFDRVLAQWRVAGSQAAVDFLDAALADVRGQR